MKRVLWVSRHHYLNSQIDALKSLYSDDVTILEHPDPFESAEEIVRKYRKGHYDDIVVVAPLFVIRAICRLGVHPLWAEMVKVSKSQAEVEVNGKHYRFGCFRRVTGIKIEFEE